MAVMTSKLVVRMQCHMAADTTGHLDGVPLEGHSGPGKTLDQNRINGILKNQ
jgi:hypothetical protein